MLGPEHRLSVLVSFIPGRVGNRLITAEHPVARRELLAGVSWLR